MDFLFLMYPYKYYHEKNSTTNSPFFCLIFMYSKKEINAAEYNTDYD